MGTAEGPGRVAVIGAGAMGHGIAEVAALAGFETVLYDIDDKFVAAGAQKITWSLSKFVEKGSLSRAKADEVASRVRGTTDMKELAACDLVIEAAPEQLSIKKEIFRKLDAIMADGSIFATNTSSIPITEIAAATRRPERFIGLHFFNPPALMPLVEVIRGGKTSDATVKSALDFCSKFGKDVVVCAKDVPGFIVNRILGALMMEAGWMVARGEATKEQIDSCCVHKVGLPMGIFELADHSGIDVIYAVARAMKEREPALPAVAPPFEERFMSRKYGKKSGEGFYSYPSEGSRPSFSREAGDGLDPLQLFAVAINSAAWLVRNQVCTKEDLDTSIKLGLGFPEGILQLADDWGIDRVVAVLEGKPGSDSSHYAPDPLLLEMARRGDLGKSSGRGFYEHNTEERKLEELILKKAPPVGWVTLNRPQRLNAITPKMMDELESVAKDLASDGSIRVVVIAGGGGKAFSAGADLTSFQFTSPAKAFDTTRRMFEVFGLFEKMPKPVIAAINGYAFGGGCELALACDFRLASESSQIGLTETNLGLIPGAGGTQRLIRLVGLSKAKEMIYFGERLRSEEALQVGLIDRVFPNAQFQGSVEDFAARLAKRPPISIKLAKYAINLATQVPPDQGQLFEAGAFGLVLSTQDASEGMTSFFSKKEPEFKGE